MIPHLFFRRAVDGKSDLKNVVVTDDKAVTVKSEHISNADGTTTPSSSDLSSLNPEDYEGTIIGFYPVLAAGECRIITVEYVIPENTETGSKIVNTANAQDDNGHNVSSSDDVTVIEKTIDIEPEYKLGIVKTANVEMADEGDTITYTIVVTNNGNTTLSNVSITDSLKVTYSGTEYPAGNVIKIFEKLEAGKSESIVVTYTVPKGTDAETIVNTATADSDETEPVTSTATVIMENPSVSISKTVSNQKVTAGDKVYYTLTVTNTGNVTLTNLLVSDAKIGYSTTIDVLELGKNWRSPENTLYYTFGSGTSTGTTFKNTASVSNDRVKGAADSSATVTVTGKDYVTPNTGDITMQAENGANPIVIASVLAVVSAFAALGCAVVIFRKKYPQSFASIFSGITDKIK